MAVSNLMVAAFGGPTEECCGKHAECPGQAFCFVNGIFGDNPARRARVDEVVEHYKHLGGFSKFNEITQAQAEAVQAELRKRGYDLKLTVGYDHWLPHIADQIEKVDGDFVVLVMAPHQSSISWDAYLRRVSEGLDKLDESSRPKWVGVVDPFWNKPGFVDALAERIKAAAKAIDADLTNSATGLVLSAHAVPMPVVKTSKYVEQIKETAELVASKVGATNWMVGYQSAPSDSKIDWTTPYLDRVIEELKEGGAQKIVAAPIGFLCDNVEVLYDLGVEGKQKADELGVPFAAAEAVNTHPAFIKQLADNVEAKLKELAVAS
ncbi:MAG: ferrochelatase [Planctomycetes bacterium]|nr:ferrochelatase [Planctomycetota bacterium]